MVFLFGLSDDASAPSHKFCIPNWQSEISSKCLHLTHLSETKKSEIRISKLETNSNNQNANDQTLIRLHKFKNPLSPRGEEATLKIAKNGVKKEDFRLSTTHSSSPFKGRACPVKC